MNEHPVFVMLVHRRLAIFLERVIFPFPARLAFAPARLDQAPVFHPVQHGIEHPVGPVQLALGTGLDLLDDGVAVALALGEQRQDQWFSRGGDEFFANHRDTIHRYKMYVKQGIYARKNASGSGKSSTRRPSQRASAEDVTVQVRHDFAAVHAIADDEPVAAWFGPIRPAT